MFTFLIDIKPPTTKPESCCDDINIFNGLEIGDYVGLFYVVLLHLPF